MTDPMVRLRADRERARDAGDANAGLCVLATADAERVAQRVLVLREVDGGFGVFVSATSPKWRQAVAAGGRAAVLVWLPSIQVQYRIDAALGEIDKAYIDRQWMLRPEVSRRLDQVYQSHPQSSPVASREALEALLEAVDEKRLTPPTSARGWRIEPLEVEVLDLSMPSGLHDRRLYRRDGEDWTETVLVP